MTAVLKPPMTLAAFLDWENHQEFKLEFDGFQPMATTGTEAHAAIQRNLIGLLYNRLRGHRCRAYGSELKIQADHSIRYPDAFIVCSPPPPIGTRVASDPVIVFEILSDSTSTIDRIDKNEEYRNTPSLQRYVIPGTNNAAMVFQRDNEDWVGHLQTGETALNLPEIEAELALADIYEGVVFPPRDGAQEAIG